MKAKQHEQLVSERVEFKSKGIGTVAVAGKSIGAKIALKFLDPILALSSLVIALVDLFGCTGAVGDDKADIASQRANFDLDHDPSSFVPASGPVSKAIEESNGTFCASILTLGLLNPALGSFLEYRVGGNADGIQDIERFQSPVDLWSSRAGIGPIADLTFSKAPLNNGNQPIELCGDSRSSTGIAGAKQCREQRAGFGFEQKQRVIHMLAVFSVKEGELLLPVAGIVSGITVQ